ncbi:abscisic-aldehyde oxidase-like isoform X2 [Malania oleifera]|uniref:abscisic-aldehyde oxidase-like isoform X2 n=1 Tax=Malania oleifera TaxID=397392 RepID=UPI0025AEB96A|nr:abscisic-aldehyde oxidase-like isoform X2 [Malania oleifera]
MEERETRNTLVFAVNGEKFELSSVDHSTTLLEFLRSQTRFKGAKLGCGEGGCGACAVLLSKFDPVLGQIEDISVSSCLTLLCSVNGCSITTTEGLGNSKVGFHPIHQRFAGFHASQCGFCTPGMCVSLFSALVNAEKTHRMEPFPGFSKLTVSEAEKAIAGNLCRCTGYRPIADACKSFAVDVDIEDLGFNSFWKNGESKEVKVSRLPFYNIQDGISTFPEFLKKETKPTMLLDSRRCSWFIPVSVEELQNLVEHDEAENGTRMKLVVGNTGMGYYKEVELYDKYIDLRYIPELSAIQCDHSGIEIGAAVTISKAILALKEAELGVFHSEEVAVFRKIAGHMEKIASGFIRNSASIGGNLVMAQSNHFPSDIATVLLSVGSVVELMTGLRREKLTLEEFLERPPLDARSILLSVKIPRWKPSRSIASENIPMLLFETCRASPRPLGNALPYLNAALLAEISLYKNSKEICLDNIQLAFGAYGTNHAIRARKIEKFLAGKSLSIDVLYEAIKLVKATVIPEDGTLLSAYRSSLAVGFLFECFSPLVNTSIEFSNGDAKILPDMFSEIKNKYSQFDLTSKQSLLSSAKQELELSKEYQPVGEPIIKSGAANQASGEAVFVDDIPSPINCLHGAFIYSTKPLARVKNIKFKSESQPDGVAAVISFKDIPASGENIGSKTKFGTGKLFSDDLTECTGQRIAFVVADSQKHADMAANIAEVDYDMENLEPPILSVEEAVERSSFFEVPSILYPKQVGDFSKGMAEADHKILSSEIRIGSQYYFYMETQTALAIPDEDDCMVVYSSCQCPEFAHATIARCLGVPGNNVRVVTRRVGGGFGGKAIQAIPVATACALAAHKLQRPVRTYLSRKTDMITVGGRHPIKITYSVGFKSNGKITALHTDILINAGIDADISPMMPNNILNGLKKYDWGALSFDVKVCKTNTSSKSAMRAPGEVQGTYIAETVIEHVASALFMEADLVRDINLHTLNSLGVFYDNAVDEAHEYSLPSIWDKLISSSSFHQRVEALKQFNSSNKWQKRGISRVPILHEVSLRPTPGKVSILCDGSVVVEVGGIELGQGLWTKVKQMAAFALSSIQCDGIEGLLKKVRVIQSDTLSLIQGGFTAGSTTSESSCEAVRLCCNILVERLTPLKESMQKQMGSIKWDLLIHQANLTAVNLSASSYYVPDFSSMRYLNYGAAVSEIEGAFVQGIGFFMLEEFLTNSDGLVVANGTWTYKIPTIDTIPKQFNVEILNSGHHRKRILSSKASGEPPLLLAVSVHCATRAAIREARKQLHLDSPDLALQLGIPATMPVVKELCGLDNVERYLQSLLPSA